MGIIGEVQTNGTDLSMGTKADDPLPHEPAPYAMPMGVKAILIEGAEDFLTGGSPIDWETMLAIMR